MIPDKIYLPKSLKAQGINRYCDWEEVEIPGYDNICYIRKDALIEWIENEIQALSDGSLSGYYISLAFKDMIEHLNEM